jgi:hypothetical protein
VLLVSGYGVPWPRVGAHRWPVDTQLSSVSGELQHDAKTPGNYVDCISTVRRFHGLLF